MDLIHKITEKINDQKEKLSKWNNDLKKNLSVNNNLNIDLFLIRKEWLDKYTKTFFNIQANNFNNKVLINSYNNFDKINDFLITSTHPINIKYHKDIFFLNITCWLSFQTDNKQEHISLKGEFLNNMLLIKLKCLKKSKLYCIFFYDNNYLRQAYLQINDLNKENIIVNNFKKQKFIDILKEYNILLSKEENNYHSNDLNFDLYIFPKILNININNKKEKLEENKVQNNIDSSCHFEKIDLKNVNHNDKIIKLETNNDNNKEHEQNSNDIKNKKIDYQIYFLNNNNSIVNMIKKDINMGQIKNNLNPKKAIKKLKRGNSAQIINLKEGKRLNHNKNFGFNEILPIKAEDRKYIPGVIGLLNIGATCYMNATLQCFSNIEGLRKKLLNKDIYQDLEKNQNTKKKLSFSLAEVLNNLWKNINKRLYAPEHFKKLISEMNNLFVGVAANDPKDLILFLLETMHKELNNPENINNINNNKIIDNRNFNDVYKEFSQNYISQNKSIICEEFYGFSNSMTNCGSCHTIIHNVQAFNIIFFPLEEIRKYKQYNHNIVSIYDCFDYYEKKDIYSSFYCNYCKQNYQAVQQSIIINAPKNIIINLNRGKGIQFNVNIIFEEFLNLKKYIYFKDSIYYYELTGVIGHFGSNDMGGHFVAFCKNSNNCQWYKYNDQTVTKSSFDEVKVSGLPYVLFYSYIQV